MSNPIEKIRNWTPPLFIMLVELIIQLSAAIWLVVWFVGWLIIISIIPEKIQESTLNTWYKFHPRKYV
jgi:hypothetical protein